MSQPATRGVAEPAGPRRRAGWLRKAGASPLPPSSSPEDRARARAVKRAASAVPKGGAQPPTLTARVSGTTIVARRGAGGLSVTYQVPCNTLRSSPDLSRFS